MGRLIDLTGKNFGRLTVIKRDETVNSKNGAYWICQCNCGNKKSIKSANLIKGATKSCGCLNKEIISEEKEIIDMIGKKFGKLTVIKRDNTHITPSGQKKVMWLCKCDCGNEKVVRSQDLKSNHTKSCGCIGTKPKNVNIIDLAGKRFGKLVVVNRSKDYVYKNNDKMTTSPQWLCKCDCGNSVIVQGGNLRNGNTTNCGCEKIKSKGEMIVDSYLNKNNIKHLREYYFNDLRNEKGNFLRFDFAILNNKNKIIMLIEYQGEQHYTNRSSFGSYQRNYSDKIKKDYCNKNNIPLFEIRYDDDLKYVLPDLMNKIKTNEI